MSTQNLKAKLDAQAADAAPRQEPTPRRSAVTTNSSGRVQFDELGNAVWEWSRESGSPERGLPDPDGRTSRLRKLENAALSLAEDAPTPSDIVKPNPQGMMRGYSPYDSGLLCKPKQPLSKKKDLRRLSEWMKLRQQATLAKQREKK